MGTVHNAQGWRRARALGVLGVTGAAAAAVVFGLPNQATSGQLDAPCSEVAANCQVGDLANSVLALGSNGSTIFASDNFSRSTTGAITHLCFWAIYNSNVPGTDDIVVTFYNDTLATSGSPGYPVGGALATFADANVTVTRADTGLDFAALDVYEYSVTLTGGFNATANTCYWVEISNAVTPADAWFILCADNSAGLGDERSTQRDGTVSWEYNDIVTGSDLAVCINGGLNLPAPTCALPAACSSATQDCNVESANPGCVDTECCGLVCVLDAVCCFGPWDAICVDLAINGAGCAAAPYVCPGGGPANDCATNPTSLAIPSSVAFDLTNANTDGGTINASCNAGDSPTTFDVWYIVEAPADGRITVDTCATNVATDLVVNIHDVGNGIYDPEDVKAETNWLVCDDDGCCPASFGCPSVSTFDVTAGTNYLIRVGTWNASTPGPGQIDVSFDPSVAIWNTGPTAGVLFNGNPANLGYTTGNTSVGGAPAPERWAAHPFTLPAVPAGGSTWHITEINADGFTVAVTDPNATLTAIVWERTGIGEAAGPPVDGDQIVVASVPFALEVGGTWVVETDFKLAPGDYWLTFTVNAIAGNTIAWFANAQSGPDGIPNMGSDITVPSNEAFFWRSLCVTAPCAPSVQGFTTNNPANVQPLDGTQNPDLLFTGVFKIFGEPQDETTCGGDCVTSATFAPPSDGNVDAADLAFLLGEWNGGASCADTVTSATFAPPPDGNVDAADLAFLLGNWGSPGCP